METITATDLHDRTAELTERAMRDPEQPIVIEKHGKPAVVLLDARYFEGLIETLDLLSDPEAMAEIRRGLADIKAGRLIDHEDVRKEFGLGPSTHRRKMEPKRSGRSASSRKSHRPAQDHRKGRKSDRDG